MVLRQARCLESPPGTCAVCVPELYRLGCHGPKLRGGGPSSCRHRILTDLGGKKVATLSSTVTRGGDYGSWQLSAPLTSWQFSC